MPAPIESSPQEQSRYQHDHRWSAAIKASLLAGAIVWLFPAGNPWTAFARPSGAYIMGRAVSTDPAVTIFSMPALPAHLLHFVVALLYGLVILGVVYRLRNWRAIFAGILTSLALYAINYIAFRLAAPQFVGDYELNVVIAHVLFGGLAAGMIRGFLRAPQRVDPNAPNPGPQYP
ncbi:MAG TPA: hypothetical protein VK846_08720 [Candidatus Limnocylindria bacterium]|nr:hypothetical protein [Candidatus Limnocylindria bacterium]